MLLDRLTLSDAVELSAAVRRLGQGADDAAAMADRIVRHLYTNLLDAAGRSATVLIRLFVTAPLGTLAPEVRDLATAQLAEHGDPVRADTRCLTLLGTVGAEREWCRPEDSRNHRVIPLPNPEALARAPMTAALLRRIGLFLGAETEAGTWRRDWQRAEVFHVEDARRHPQIPDQEQFVEPYGIRSVLGFGGMLPSGDALGAVLFSRLPIGEDVASLFEPVGQSVRLAMLPFMGSETTPGEAAAEIRVEALERLLDVLQDATRVQARRVEDEARVSTTLLSVAESIGQHLDLSEIIQQVTDAATELCGAQFGAFFYNAVAEGAESYRLFTLSGAPREAFAKFPQPRSTPIFGPTFRGEPSIRIDDVTTDPRYGTMPPYHGLPPGHPPVRSYLAVPVNARSGEVLGGLFFGHEEPNRFSEVHERLVTGLARHAALAIDNARLYEQAQERLAARESALEQVRRAERRYRSLVRASSQLVWRTRADGLVDDLPEWREFTGQSRAEVRGWGWLDAIHPDDREATRDAWQKAVASGEVFETEYRLRTVDGDYRPQIARGVPVRDGGEVREWVGMCVDISDLRRQASERLALVDRLRMVAAAGQFFASALDVDTVVNSLLRVLVPGLGDWGCVHLKAADRIRLAGVAAAEQSLVPRLREGLERFEPSAEQPYGPGYVISAGASQWLPEITDEMIAASVGGDAPRWPADALRPTSGVVVPLATRGRVIGAVTLATSGGRRLTDDDRDLVEEVARRAALALDNATLFASQRDLAMGLQQGLLPELPTIPGLQICSRYLAAARSAEVGGDWYDAFTLRDGSVGLAIGDVMGHDVAATTAMGQLRSVLRTCAWEGQPPGRVLERLDQLVQVFGMADLATLIYAQLQRPQDGQPLRLRYANAGHVPPLLLVPGQKPVLLHGTGNLLIGVPGSAHWVEQSVELLPGSTLVLYTDGLVERPDRDIDVGISRLQTAAAAASELETSALCDHLIAAAEGSRQKDDIAMLAVRVLG